MRSHIPDQSLFCGWYSPIYVLKITVQWKTSVWKHTDCRTSNLCLSSCFKERQKRFSSQGAVAIPFTTIVGSFPCVITTVRGRLLLTLSRAAIFIAISLMSSVCQMDQNYWQHVIKQNKTLTPDKEKELGSKTAQKGQYHRDHLVFWKYLLNWTFVFFIDTGFYMQVTKPMTINLQRHFLNFTFVHK